MRRYPLASLLLVLMAASCGTRVDRGVGGESASVQVENGSRPVESAPETAHVNPEPGSNQAAPVDLGSSPTVPVRTKGNAATGAAGRSGLQPDIGGTRTTTAPIGGDSAGGQITPTPGSRPAGGALPPQGRELPQKSPVLIASVGTYSGPVGESLKPSVDALRVWVRLINDRGGLNGHQVRLFVYDDGGDPARQKAQVQEAVDQKKVIAFVQATIGVSGPISMDYITAKRVPVIGVDGGARWFYDYPMIFPQATSGTFLTQASVWGIAQQTVPAGKTKFGTVVCAEVEDCDTFGRVARATAPQAGLRVVYQAKSSVAQPDFTAECISARNADAQVLYVVMDTNSLGRLSSACARQGYRPTFASVSVIVADRLKSDPNLDGLTAVSPVFPWFQKGTPATDEFQEAIKTYGSSVAVGAAATVGWVSAKLFEKAGAAMPEPPTSDAVLRGLWGLRDEALGGLTQPLTFHENQNAPKRLMCWFNFTAKSGSWVSTDGFKLQCRPSDESLK